MDFIATPLAVSGSAVGGIVPFLVGVVLVGGLIWAVWWGRRLRSRESAPPRPEEQPRLPDSGPVGEVRERREPSEVPRSGNRLNPNQVRAEGNSSSHRAADQEAPTWDENSSGGFGSGGPGRT
ncbi:hypothetical protein KUF83_27385 [Streptomyces sp. BV286]|uniref:DUF6479 family protein n=1 Tax=Streptomyces sp. BV286 TaxID=2849672 RepID=UPI001C2ECBAF|nr:DUF6479 family protein [Streptomyces sp. BV286]MBV1940261.1 hypothetical protein [Streptomyces sp. BV286]